MSNSFNIDVKPQIAAVVADIAAVYTLVDLVDTAVFLISLDTTAIKSKTDATPQNVRGKFYSLRLATGEIDFQDVVNVSGHGKINKIVFNSIDVATTIYIKIILDGTSFATFSHVGDIVDHILILWESPAVADIWLTSIPFINADNNLFNLEFNSSLLVQISSGQEGASNIVQCRVNYTLDAF